MSANHAGQQVAREAPRPALTPATFVAFVADIFARRGDEEYLGEPVSMSQHMLQAAHFAEQAKQPDEVIVAALLHDIGHFTSEFGTYSPDDTEDRHHEDAGGDLLAPFLPALRDRMRTPPRSRQALPVCHTARILRQTLNPHPSTR